MFIDAAAKMKWSLTQLDVSNAFLNGDLDEEIYMKLPQGYEELMGVSVPKNAVCRLHKSLYGLKQASRQWYLKLSSTILKMGFMKSRDDHTLFVRNVEGIFLAVLIYVDDILVASNNDMKLRSLLVSWNHISNFAILVKPNTFLDWRSHVLRRAFQCVRGSILSSC